MKRLLILLVVLGLGAGSVSTATAKAGTGRVQRTVKGNYGAYPAPVTGCNEALGFFACMIIPSRRGEAFFTADVRDAHGLPVYVQVTSSGGYVASFCGKTKQPIQFPARGVLRVHVGLPVWGVQLDCPQHSVKTTGSITVTLSNRP